MAARESTPLLARLFAAFRPELAEAAEEVVEEVNAALGRDGIERIRAAGTAVGKVLDVLEARRDQAGARRKRG